MQKIFYNWCLAALITALIVTFCYFNVDRQVAYLFAPYKPTLTSNFWMKFGAEIPAFFFSGIPVFFVYLIAKFSLKKWSQFDLIFALLTAASGLAYSIRELLKVVFGRYWIDTFIDNNISLLKNNAYGFNWFTNGSSYKSFPSGHMIGISVISAILYIMSPKLRKFAICLTLVVACCQMILCYHYVSDIIAGTFIGSLIGYYFTIIVKSYLIVHPGHKK